MQKKDTTFYKILPNGLKIVHRNSFSEVAYVGVTVGVGTRDELPQLNGLAHYVEHTVFKGCQTAAGHELTSRQIINKIEGIGGEINAYTTKEETTFYAATPVRHYKQTLQLLADLVLRPTFPKRETDKELGVILDEIESYEDSPSELIYDDFENIVFNGYSLAQPILGKRKTLKTISSKPDYPHDWVKNNFIPSRMVVFSQGKMPFDAVCREVERAFADCDSFHLSAASAGLSSASAPASTPASSGLSSASAPASAGLSSASSASAPASAGLSSASSASAPASAGFSPVVPLLRETPTGYVPQSVSFRRHTHQTHVMLGGRAYPLGHEKQLAMYLLNNILGGGSLNSRLNLSLREQKGLVYTVESQYVPLSDTGYWCIYFATDPQNVSSCMELVMAELRKLREEPLSPAQLQRALMQLRGQMAISAENQENNVLAMAKQMLYFSNAPTWQDVFLKVSATTPDTLLEVANDLFLPASLSVLTYS